MPTASVLPPTDAISMRRAVIVSATFAVALIGMGCKHIAGKCDSNYDPANNAMPVTSNPYPVTGPTISGTGVAAPSQTAPAPKMHMPKPDM